jgi:hypothetical protein
MVEFFSAATGGTRMPTPVAQDITTVFPLPAQLPERLGIAEPPATPPAKPASKTSDQDIAAAFPLPPPLPERLGFGELEAPVPPTGPAKTAALQTAGFNFIVYRRTEGPTVITGAVRREPGGIWIETNTRGSKWTFRSVSESATEIVLYDASRDIYLRIDLAAKQLFVRQGSSQSWQRLSELTRADH